MFDELFSRKTVNIQKALLFGFVCDKNGYIYETAILGGTFLLQITISAEGKVDTRLTEKATGEEYTLYKTHSALGTFVGEVRNAVQDVLTVIADECFDTEVFSSLQAKEIIAYVRDKYGDAPEYLWTKFPDNAVWRCKDNKKWYGALLTVRADKLGIDCDKKIEILDLRIKAEELKTTVDGQRFFKGYHMNKKHWYTLLLNGSIPTEEICRRIDESYVLAKR